MPATLFPGLERFDFTTALLIDVLAQQYRTRFKRIEAFIEPTIASEDHTALLGVHVGSPALVLDRVLFNDKDQPVAYSQSFVRGDRCRYCFKTR
jgi:GntR family transcriptional regulator